MDPDGAEAAGVPIRLRTLAVVTTLVIVSAISAVGIILVIALLCAPVVGLNQAGSLSGAMVRASVIGSSCSLGGFGLALLLDLPLDQ